MFLTVTLLFFFFLVSLFYCCLFSRGDGCVSASFQFWRPLGGHCGNVHYVGRGGEGTRWGRGRLYQSYNNIITTKGERKTLNFNIYCKQWKIVASERNVWRAFKEAYAQQWVDRGVIILKMYLDQFVHRYIPIYLLFIFKYHSLILFELK